jgi:cell division protein FtsI/penicillin-binding protein 2
MHKEKQNKGIINLTFDKKIKIISTIFVLFFIVLIGRLFNVQILNSEKFQLTAKKQTQKKEIIRPLRGIIFDRNMKPLVTNVFDVSITANPKRIKNIDSTLNIISKITEGDKGKYISLLSQKEDSEIQIEKLSGVQETRKFDTLKLDGINITKSPVRYYTYGSLASQVLGYTDDQYKGRSGIEYTYDKELTGSTGLVIMQKDGQGNKRPFQGLFQKYPENGSNIVVTIDINIQQIIEEELLKGVKESGAKGGKVLVISVRTGEILAMSSYPTFNPNEKKSSDTSGMKNRVISDIYEPGSTYKLITAAGSLEDNLFNRNSVINTENGEYVLGKDLVIKDVHGLPSMTFEEVIINSSNVGIAKISERLGKEKFYKYSRNFGLGTFSGIEIMGENKGLLKHPSDFKNGTLQFCSMGYQIMTNVLQISLAYASIANNGFLMKPLIVKKCISPEGKILWKNEPITLRQTVSEKTAKILNEFLVGVINNGTGTAAELETVSAAGKTGTTQILTKSGYSKTAHNGSFIGYFPSDSPSLLVAVYMDELVNTGDFYGGKVAAPVFKRISDRIIEYVGQNSLYSPEFLNEDFNKLQIASKDIKTKNENEFIMPDFTGMELRNAITILNEKKIKFEIEGIKNEKETIAKGVRRLVVEQSIAAGKEINEKDATIKFKIKDVKSEWNNTQVIPDVVGLSLRQAITKLSTRGFNVEITGTGKVESIEPKVGELMPNGTKVKIIANNKN